MRGGIVAEGATPSGTKTLTFSLVGRSEAFTAVKGMAAAVADRHCTVMVLGETGTGKEMIARYLHARSRRRDQPFVPVDCSALPDSIFESQVFGHVRGAFTGAVRDTLGFIRAAEGGTLFLDEIGELSLPMQAKLLRVIQERRVVPLGAAGGVPVDVRIVTATHRDLPAMVRRGEFRQDLYFRLNVVALTIPSLRQRAEDIGPLAEHFLKVQAELYGESLRRLSPQAAAALRAHAWPGNVRELANAMERAHVLARDGVIDLADLSLPQSGSESDASPSDLCLAEIERRAITEALRRTRNCKAAASRLLGINVQRLNRRIRHLRIHPSRA